MEQIQNPMVTAAEDGLDASAEHHHHHSHSEYHHSHGEHHHHSEHHHHHHHHGKHHHRRGHLWRAAKRKIRSFFAGEKAKWAPGTPGAKLKRWAGLIILAVAIPGIVLIGARYLEKRDNRVDPATAVYHNTTPGAFLPVSYQGEVYVPNTNIKSYLFMGIDASGPVKEVSYIGGGQADTLLLLVVDNKAETWDVLQINRDTITDVQVLGVLGDAVGTEQVQIALAHSYGDGRKSSCRNTVKAVSDLLGGCETSGYLSLNMDGICLLVDGIGGVDVTLEADYTELGSQMVQGATVHMDGKTAYEYLRYRRGIADQTNIDRMGRHRSFVNSAVDNMEKLTRSDTLSLYGAVSDYMVTDMTDGEIWEVINRLQRYRFRGITTMDGTALEEKGVMAYHLNETSLQETILQLFYHIQ